MLFYELRVEIDLLNKFHHLAKGIPVKLSECEKSCRCVSQSGIKGGTCQQLQTAEKSSNTHFTPTLTYQIPIRKLCSNIMDVKPTFSVLELKQAFDGMIQEVDLEPSKQYIDLERYLFDVVEYLQPELVKNLRESDGDIYLFLSVDVKYNNPWQRFGNDDDDEPDDDEPFTLHYGKLFIKNLDQLVQKL